MCHNFERCVWGIGAAAARISASGGSAHVLDALLSERDDRFVAVAEHVREVNDSCGQERQLRALVFSDYGAVAGEEL